MGSSLLNGSNGAIIIEWESVSTHQQKWMKEYFGHEVAEHWRNKVTWSTIQRWNTFSSWIKNAVSMLAQRVWTMLAQTVFDIILTFQSRALRLSCQGYWTKLLPRRSRKARVAMRRWRGLGMFRMIPSSSDDFMGFWVYGQDSNDFHRPSKLHMLAPCGVASFRQFCWCGWIFFSKVSLCLLSGARNLAPLGRHGAKTPAASARRFLGSEWQLVRWAPSHLQRLPMDDGWQS